MKTYCWIDEKWGDLLSDKLRQKMYPRAFGNKFIRIGTSQSRSDHVRDWKDDRSLDIGFFFGKWKIDIAGPTDSFGMTRIDWDLCSPLMFSVHEVPASLFSRGFWLIFCFCRKLDERVGERKGNSFLWGADRRAKGRRIGFWVMCLVRAECRKEPYSQISCFAWKKCSRIIWVKGFFDEFRYFFWFGTEIGRGKRSGLALGLLIAFSRLASDSCRC